MNRTEFIGLNLYYSQEFVDDMRINYKREIERLKEENRQIKILKEKYQIEKEVYKLRIDKALDKLYCYGEIFDRKILQQFQKEMIDLLVKVNSNE